jgi:two-component system, OmpR family, phosphate regulon sensor histidine kinase PhoR
MNWKMAIYTTVFVLALGMVITLIVFWNVYIIGDYQTIKELNMALHGNAVIPSRSRWTILVLGIVFLSLILTVLSVFFANVMRNTRFKRQQKDFINMVTHELRLPMSSIQMFTQTLSRNEISDADRKIFLDRILGECQRMNLLIDHLLKSQAIETGRLPIHLQNFDLSAFLKDFTANWPRPVSLQLPESTTHFIADPVLLELALANLVSNAEKYGKGHQPYVTLDADAKRVTITVLDGGSPIPRKYLRHLFKRFYRIPNRDTRKQSGVGLGLYIVRNILRSHKGQVSVIPDSLRPDGQRGNAFCLVLPRQGGIHT